jgi:hypothetical protein
MSFVINSYFMFLISVASFNVTGEFLFNRNGDHPSDLAKLEEEM